MRSDQAPAEPGAGDRRYVRVAQRLLAAINRGDHPVGGRLPADRDIAAAAGVSRATAREALLVLELIGVVEASIGAGVYVRSQTPRLVGDDSMLEAPADLVETRLLIEPIVARLCAERATPETVADLTALADRAQAAASGADPFPLFSDLSLEFHAALARHCGNQVLSGIARQLVEVNEHPLWVLLNQSVLRTVADRLEQVRHHRAIVEAIRAGDQEAAAAAMTAHLDELAAVVVGHRSALRSRLSV